MVLSQIVVCLLQDGCKPLATFGMLSSNAWLRPGHTSTLYVERSGTTELLGAHFTRVPKRPLNHSLQSIYIYIYLYGNHMFCLYIHIHHTGLLMGFDTWPCVSGPLDPEGIALPPYPAVLNRP